MQIPVRLYRQHDMDLIRVYMNKSLRLTAEMRNSLIAYANGKTYSIPFSDSPPEYRGYLKTSILVHILVDEDKHPEIISMFNKLKRGQRCAFIKTLTRRCMTELPLSTYFSGDGIIMSKREAAYLEERGAKIEGNSLLVNEVTPKASKEIQKRYQGSKDKVNHTLTPLHNQESKPETLVSPYIPDDVPYVNELTSSIEQNNGEVEKEDGAENAFALFGKLAH